MSTGGGFFVENLHVSNVSPLAEACISLRCNNGHSRAVTETKLLAISLKLGRNPNTCVIQNLKKMKKNLEDSGIESGTYCHVCTYCHSGSAESDCF